MNRIILAASILVLTACSQTQFSPVTGSDGINTDKGTQDNAKPLCEVEYYDYILDTDIMSYEFTDSEGVNFGFNLGGLIKAIDLSVQITNSKINLGMQVSTMLQPSDEFDPTLGDASSTSVGIKGDIGLSQIGLGFNYYQSTGVSKLTAAGLKNTFQNLSNTLTAYEKQKSWMTRVSQTPEGTDYVVIQAGINAGLRNGDSFNIYNVTQLWSGEPCNSKYNGEVPNSSSPIAVAHVIELESNTAILQIDTPKVKNSDIQLGASVSIASLPLAKGEKSRSLARSVLIRSLTSQKLLIGTSTEVDIGAYAKEQLPAIITPAGTKNRYYSVQQ